MKRRPLKQTDKISHALYCLCQDVQKKAIRIPIPEVLTWAMKGLFPGENIIPDGTVFILNTADSRVTWSVEESRVSVKVNYWNAVWLRRRLSSYM